MFTSRQQSKVIETRSVFSSTTHHASVVHIQEMYFSSALRGFSPVVCKQLSLPPIHQVRLFVCVLHFLPLLVGGWISLEIVDGLLTSRCAPSSWFDGWLVNEIGSYSVGALRPPNRPMCLSVSCLIQNNLVKNMVHKLSPGSCYPIHVLMLLISGGGGGTTI